jgi:uncharacterized protein (DUF1778 family)
MEYDKWQLNPDDSRALIESLFNPPQPNDALKAAAARYIERLRPSSMVNSS